MSITAIKLTAEHADLSVTEMPFVEIAAALMEADARRAAGQRVTVTIVYGFETAKADEVA